VLTATIDSALRLHQHQAGRLVALEEYLYRRSGMIGSLPQLIRGAAILAIEDGSEQITRDLLEAVPIGYAAKGGGTARPAVGRRRNWTPARPQGRSIHPPQKTQA
jgi:hypothetical protein